MVLTLSGDTSEELRPGHTGGGIIPAIKPLPFHKLSIKYAKTNWDTDFKS